MSIISGIPCNAKYINELLDKKMITTNEAEKLLMFTHFSNPLFILGTVGILFLDNYKMGLLILFSHYISNIIIGISIRNYHPDIKDNTFSLRKAIINMNEKSIKSDNFGKVLTKALMDSINTLLLILGVVTFFLILTTIINNQLHLSPLPKSIVSGLFEMTQGLSFIGNLDISMRLKAVLSTMIISFGGLSCHMQVMSILSEKKIKYFPYFISRILHVLISGIITYLLVF
jgi:sporulation integral membrane protein YlbJ